MRRKKVFALAVLVAAAVGIVFAMVDLSEQQARVRQFEPPPSFGEQVLRVRSRANEPIPPASKSIFVQEMLEEARDQAIACSRLLNERKVDSTTDPPITLVDQITFEVKPCGFTFAGDVPRVDYANAFDYGVKRFVLASVYLLSLAFTFSHAHRGWRRLAIVAGTISGVGIALYSVFAEASAWVTLWTSSLGGLLVAALAIALREGALWVRAGFQER